MIGIRARQWKVPGTFTKIVMALGMCVYWLSGTGRRNFVGDVDVKKVAGQMLPMKYQNVARIMNVFVTQRKELNS
jgi:hypothetical protein